MCILTLSLLLLAGPAWAKPAPKASWEPPNDYVAAYNEAARALNAGNPAEAERIAARIVQKLPDCGIALTLLAQARTRLNQPEKALQPAQHAVELFPDRADAHGVLGEAAFAAQQFELAELESGRASELEPTEPGLAALAVQTCLRLGHLDEAKKRLAAAKIGDADRACLDVDIYEEAGDRPAAEARLAGCTDDATPGIRDAVRASFTMQHGDAAAVKDAVSTLGLSGYELVLKGETLVRDGKWEEAVPVLQAALVAAPHEISAHVNLGIALEALGRYADAEKALAEAVSGDTWVDVHATGKITGITTKSSEEQLRDMQREAAVLLVRVQTKGARTGAATKTLADARARFGDALDLLVAEAELRAAEGKPVEAWSLLRAAVARGEKNDALARGVAVLAVEHPDGLDTNTAGYVRTNGRSVDVLNLAIAESNGKAYVACADDADLVLAKDPKAPRAAEVGYACAVFADLPDRAASYLAQLGPDVDRRLIHDHALTLQGKDRHADALALLAKYPADGEMEPKLRALAIRSHVAEKRWSEVAGLAAKPGLDPQFSMWVASQLLQVERKNDAARVLGGVCGQVSGKDAADCKQMLAYAAQ